MAVTSSPLRYPGGKSSLRPLVAEILKLNDLQLMPYAEPYAGGCGLALDLLFGGYVSEVHLNDIDRSIWAFWDSVLNETDSLVELIRCTEVTMEEWHRQREIFARPDEQSSLDLGFATFFLNRTNRSGIIKGAGVIGGKSQNGDYKIDCRYNKEVLIRRIRRVEKYKERIFLYNYDALEFIEFSSKGFEEKTFFCIDPPYYNKGSSLYTSFYKKEDHLGVSNVILSLDQPWIVTYDNAEEVRDLYQACQQYTFDIKYSVQTKRIGTELLIASSGLKVPSEITATTAPIRLSATA